MKLNLERITSFIAAIILLQTLYFKFTAAPESVYIFSELGLEPYGRIGIAIFELITAFLLLFRKTLLFGAIFGLFIILGAILSHLFVLGIEVQNDGGMLFGLAIVVFICCSTIVYKQKEKLFDVIKKYGFRKY